MYSPGFMLVNTTRPALFVTPRCSDPLTTTCAERSGLPRRSVTSTLTVAVVWIAGVTSAAGAIADASRKRQSEDIMATPRGTGLDFDWGHPVRSRCHEYSP